MAHEDVLRRFGENLWWVRTRRRFSQEVLADRAQIHRTQISSMETGQRSLMLPTFVALAAALEVPTEKLLEGIVFEPAVRGPGGFLVEPLTMADLELKSDGGDRGSGGVVG